MLKDVVAAEPLEGYQIKVRFDDGVEGVIHLDRLVHFRGVFEPLRDLTFFRKVRADPNVGTVVWPNGADLDPDVLYSLVTPIPATPTP